MVKNYLQDLLKIKNNFLILFFGCLFFPFFIKINIFNKFDANIKDIIFLISAIWLHISRIKKIKNKNNIKLINSLLILICFIHIFSSLFFLHLSKGYSIYFYQSFFRSIVICYCCIIFFFFFDEILNKKNILLAIKLFYFINLLIFIEFFFSVILKVNFDFLIIKIKCNYY